MLDVVLSVAGDQKYFDMAKISIPSFLRSNPTAKLHVFSDCPEKIESNYKLEKYDIREAVKLCDKSTLLSLTSKMQDFDNNGVLHKHSYVALLPLFAERVCSNDILKIDVDSFFHGDMCSKLDGLFDAIETDLVLVSRTRDDIMTMYGGSPGVGFTMWRKGGQFVKTYIEFFDGFEQSTILDIAKHGLIPNLEVTDENFHICYPFKRARELGREFMKEDLDEFEEFYIHVNGEGEGQLEKLKKLEKWYG